jgi:hypothetical protein
MFAPPDFSAARPSQQCPFQALAGKIKEEACGSDALTQCDAAVRSARASHPELSLRASHLVAGDSE